MKTIINSSLKLFLGSVLIMGLNIFGINSFQNEENKNIFVYPIVIEDNGLQFNLKTDKKNVAEVLKDLKIHLNQNDILMPAPETSISAGTKIIIKRASEISIKVDGEIIRTFTSALNVADALKEKNISLNENDKVIPNFNDPITNNLEIKVVRVKQEIISNIISIKPPVEIRQDDSLPFGKTKIINLGRKGEKEQTFLITYENNREVGRELISEKIICQPQPKIVVKGTKISIGRTQTGKATWYARGLRNPQALTAASNSFLKGTYLRITNLENNKQVIIKVNDTGAFGSPRVIDLSSGAFKKLAPLSKGVISVKVEEIL